MVSETFVKRRLKWVHVFCQPGDPTPIQASHNKQTGQDAVIVGRLKHPHAFIKIVKFHRFILSVNKCKNGSQLPVCDSRLHS